MRKFILFLLLLSTAVLMAAPPKDLLNRAQMGNVNAQNDLGVYYQREGNFKEAAKYYKLAADKGEYIAQYNLGELLLQSEGLSPSRQTVEEALGWFQKAAKNYYTKAYGKVGICLYFLNRYEEAIPYLQQATWIDDGDNNYANCCNLLGKCYFWGLGTDIDWGKAKEYYLKEKNAKSSVGINSIFELGFLYFIEESFQEAEATWREDLAIAEVSNIVKKAYYGVKSDYKPVKSLHNLGYLNYKGLGTFQSDRLAVSYWRRAAEAGFPPSQFCLGWCYCNGVGVPQNEDSAKYWFCEAVKHSKKEWGLDDNDHPLFQQSTYGYGIPKEMHYQDALSVCKEMKLCSTIDEPIVVGPEQPTDTTEDDPPGGPQPVDTCAECVKNNCKDCEKCGQCEECKEKCKKDGGDPPPPVDGCEECLKNNCKPYEKCKDCPGCKQPPEDVCKECKKDNCKPYEKCKNCPDCKEPQLTCEECRKNNCHPHNWCVKNCPDCGGGGGHKMQMPPCIYVTIFNGDVKSAETCPPLSPASSSTDTWDSIHINMVLVKPGKFTMGCTMEQGCMYNEKPAHEVSVDGFYISQTEVTQALWQKVMGTNPSAFQQGASYPVEKISWNDCQTFIKKLNEMTGLHFDLPTEAQWEYAARGGHLASSDNNYIYAGGDEIDGLACYNNGQEHFTMPVGSYKPNILGLYDMSGNVMEWCKDKMGPYTANAQTNPTGPAEGSSCVMRGGCWKDEKEKCRLSYRYGSNPMYKMNTFGLRLVLIP